MKQKRLYNLTDLNLYKQRNGKYFIVDITTFEILAYNLNKDLLIRKVAKLFNISFDYAKLEIKYATIYPAIYYKIDFEKKKLNTTLKRGITEILKDIGEIPRYEFIETTSSWYVGVKDHFSWFEVKTSAEAVPYVSDIMQTLCNEINKLGCKIELKED